MGNLDDRYVVGASDVHLQHVQIRHLEHLNVVRSFQKQQAREEFDKVPFMVEEGNARFSPVRVGHNDEIRGDFDTHVGSIETGVGDRRDVLLDPELVLIECENNFDELFVAQRKELVLLCIVVRRKCVRKELRVVEVLIRDGLRLPEKCNDGLRADKRLHKEVEFGVIDSNSYHAVHHPRLRYEVVVCQG